LIKDESLLEVASSCPNNTAQLGRIRGFSEKAAKGKLGSDFLKAITRGANVPREQYPSPNIRRDTVNASGAVVDLLKVLLKLKCEQHGVAQKLVAKNSDLVQIAAGNTSVKALTGWRYSIFGSDALKLCNGTISLHVSSGEISISTIESGIKIHG
jgi:ribonuclease D